MKDIILIRTSTLRQDVDEQLKETIEFQSSISKNETIVVGGKGASAIKLDEQYLYNINRVYNLIEEGDIECVYAWSVDRIGRNEELLMQFKNRLIASGVQLRIKNPTLQLLNDDGSVNSGMEIAFSLFATMSKQEMEVKKKRFKRAKKHNKEVGKYNGGKVKFGYAVDPEGYYIPDPVNEEHVQNIFRMYADTPVSISYVTRHFIEKGVFSTTQKTTEALVNRMLKDEGYIGKTFYPRLIDDSTFHRVQEKMKEYRILPKNKYKVVPYFCQGLLYDLEDDGTEHRMRVKKSEVSYMSYTEKFSLNINTFDSMVVQVIDMVLKTLNMDVINEAVERRISEMADRKKVLMKELDKLSERERDLDEKYFVNGTITNYEELKTKIHYKATDIKKQISNLENETIAIEGDIVRSDIDIYTMSDEQKRIFILENIDRIYARKTDKWESHINIEMLRKLNISVSVMYDRKSKSFRLTSSPYWEKIRIIRNIEGRKREYGKKALPVDDNEAGGTTVH